MPRFADVIVPVPIPAIFTYLIPTEMEGKVEPLFRVAVPFGHGKFYTAIVTDVKDKFTGDYDIKEIVWAPDSSPILRRQQLRLWEWMAEYYMCPIGDVFKAALPSGLKIESETYIEINSDFDLSVALELSPKLQKILEFLRTNEISSVKAIEKSGIKDVMAAIYKLLELKAVTIHEKLTERFRPRKEEFYHVTLDRKDPNVYTRVFSGIRSVRQQQLLMKLLQLSNFAKQGEQLTEISRASILGEEFYDRTALRSLEKKGYIRIESREISRFKWSGAPTKPLPSLSSAQSRALKEIHSLFGQHPVVLLHGVTSSGKTEVYIHLIDFVLKQNKQVLYLVPEIALTTQLTKRLQDVFGASVVIYHSRFSDAERSEIWLNLLRSDKPCVVIGARSSVFLPFANLGLVIVDEEHEQSYKQFDPAPRYNARDVATVLARLHGAKTLLGSATPSIESYYKAQTGRYGLVNLSERFSQVQLPEIRLVDMTKAYLKKEVTDSFASETLVACREALGAKQQVIVFNNRRGFAPIARCTGCEYIPKCTDCDVSLTYHKSTDRLQCHYCGKEYPMTHTCPVCQQPTLKIAGYGTERVEDNVADLFPEAKILRMDLDTTRNKENYSEIIDKFSEHKADILVGTQMVTKGLDFADVSTVAVLNADAIINYPDYHASERAFNMLAQVSGRAGRRQDVPGTVLIQSRNIEHPVISFASRHDYTGFYEHELAHRKEFAYPPFSRLIYIIVRHKDLTACIETAAALAANLTALLGNRIAGPQVPAVNRIKTYHLRRIMVKIEPTVSVSQVKKILLNSVSQLRAETRFRRSDIYFDVDP